MAMDLLKRPRLEVPVEEKAAMLDKMAWASDFSFPQVRNLAARMDLYHVPSETVLFHEGDREAYFVLIVRGRVLVAKFDGQRKPRRLATIGEGKTIGEMIIIDGEPRSASALTDCESTLMVMTEAHYRDLVDSTPRVAVVLLSKIAKLMSQHLRQTSGRLIDHLGVR